MSEHTPTPWRLEDLMPDRYVWLIVADDGADPPNLVAELTVRPDSEGKTNTEYIVRAVNSHADLLAALEGYRAQHDRSSAAGRCDCLDCNVGRAALKQATDAC